MSTTVSSHFRIDVARLWRAGALDVPLDGAEAPVYIDPRLLRDTQVPELSPAMDDLGRHFATVLATIELAGKSSGDERKRLREHAKQMLLFPELSGLRIGYGKGGASGKGLGTKRAKELFDLAERFIQDDFQRDPLLLEMFTIVQPRVGADLVSDMIASVARERLYAFSARVARDFGLPTREFHSGQARHQVAWNPIRDEPILFPPRDAVADIPSFKRSKHFDRFAFSNPSIRKALSDWIKQHGSVDVRQFLLANRQLIPTALAAYSASPPAETDHFAGKEGPRLAALDIYDKLAPSFAPARAPETPQELAAAVEELCSRFKEHIEAGRSRRHLHGDRKPRDEKFVQDMFALIAATYCEDREIKLAREVDDGMGPVDFLFARGTSRVSVMEMKLSSNSALVATYEHQVSAYGRASGATALFFMAVDLKDEVNRLEQLVQKDATLGADPRRPRLFVVDGRDSPSASKIKKDRKPLPQPKAPSVRRPHGRPGSLAEALFVALGAIADQVEERNRQRRP